MSTVIRAVARVPKPLWWIAALALILVMAWTQPAAAQECPAVDEFGNVRECTMVERLGQCWWNAGQSYFPCEQDARGSFFQWLPCYGALFIDFYSCPIITLGGLIKYVK